MANEKSLALLRHGNLLFVVHSIYEHGEADFEEMQHYYEEKACPPDYIDDVVAVVDLTNMNADPHGIFEFIGEVKRPDFIYQINSDNIKELLAEHLDKLKPIK